jgi:hypothetical protein
VLIITDRSGKGDGEGIIIQEDRKNERTAKQNKKNKKNQVKPDDSKTADLQPDTTSEPATVLSDYADVDTVLLKLYDIFTRDPGILVQIQIDRYLFAASRRFVEQCGGDLETCVLREGQVPSIFNLPDIVYILRQRLVRGSWANATQETVCRYTIPGMQKSRWVTRQRKTPASSIASNATNARSSTNRATNTNNMGTSSESKSQEDTDTSLIPVYINTMLGLLLGLYPRCSKRPGFTMRVRIVRAVRALLTSNIQIQTDFILRHVSLVRLAMVEYFANVLELYCPSEYKLLQNHVDVDAYVNLCRSSCDLFRVNNLSEGAQEKLHNEPLNWMRLDQLAYKMTDKIIRSTRVETKLVNYVSIHHKSIKKLVSSDIYKNKPSRDEFLSFVKGCAVACWHDDHNYLYQRMLIEEAADSKTRGNNAEIIRQVTATLDLNLVVSDVHSILSITMLPANFIRAQVETLRKRYEHDTIPLLVISKKRICLHCLLRIAPKQFVLEEKINGNIRMDLNNDTVICNRCMSSAHVINIDLIGRILRINQQYLYICIECGSVHEWRADGSDLIKCPSRPKERLKLRNDLRNDSSTTTEIQTSSMKCRTHCFVCSKLCTGNGLWLLHVASMRMIHFYLCSVHLPPLHMLPYIIETGDYQRWLHNASTNNNGSNRKKRRY